MEIHEHAGGLSVDEVRQVRAAHPMDWLPRSTVQTPDGPRPAPQYRDSWGGPISTPRAVLERLAARTAAVLAVNPARIEPPHLVLYLPGGRYGLHHDSPRAGAFAERLEASGGPRTHTVVVGLTNNHRGGGLRFPDLELVVHPRLGWLTWWENATEQARHEALPTLEDSPPRIVLVQFVRRDPRSAQCL